MRTSRRMPRMTSRTSERVLTLPYAGLRGLGPAHQFGATGQSTGSPAFRAPARLMSSEGATEGLLAEIVASYPVEQYARRVQGLVTDDRFSHIVRVTHLALQFAEANGFSAVQKQQVATAAILHDAARDMTGAQLMELAPPELELERRHPLALHGRAGRALAARWGVHDEGALSAIEGHVFGVPPSDLVGMAVYVADVSEEGRGVNQQIRQLAMTDLPAAYKLAVRSKVQYLQNAGKEIHPDTMATYRNIVDNADETVPPSTTAAATGVHGDAAEGQA